MRVVLDTNILISALWKPDGLEARVVGLALENRIVPYVSAELWEEYRDVLFRKKFARLGEAATKLLAALAPCVIRVVPVGRVTWSKDVDDNRVLECAQEARADYLITGNLADFPAEWATSKVVNARTFLRSYCSGAEPVCKNADRP